MELARNGRKQLEKLKKYISAIKLLNCAKSVSQYMEVIETFDSLGDFLDSKKLYNHACKKVYEEADEAVARYSTDKLAYAASTFEAIKFYEDAGQRAQECRERQLALIAQNEEQKRRATEETDELELQHCLKILNNPKAQEEEIGKVLSRLSIGQQSLHRRSVEVRTAPTIINIGIHKIPTLFLDILCEDKFLVFY